MGMTLGTPGGVVIVTECFLRNAAASAADATALEVDLGGGETAFDGAEKDWAGVEEEAASSFRRFFLSFFSFLSSDVLG